MSLPPIPSNLASLKRTAAPQSDYPHKMAKTQESTSTSDKILQLTRVFLKSCYTSMIDEEFGAGCIAEHERLNFFIKIHCKDLAATCLRSPLLSGDNLSKDEHPFLLSLNKEGRVLPVFSHIQSGLKQPTSLSVLKIAKLAAEILSLCSQDNDVRGAHYCDQFFDRQRMLDISDETILKCWHKTDCGSNLTQEEKSSLINLVYKPHDLDTRFSASTAIQEGQIAIIRRTDKTQRFALAKEKMANEILFLASSEGVKKIPFNKLGIEVLAIW